MEVNKNKCYHCKHAGNTFKIGSLSHLHCHHTKHEPRETVWETLREWWDTCKDFETKTTDNEKIHLSSQENAQQRRTEI